MAVVDITEYDKLAIDNMGARVAAGVEPSAVVQQIPVTGTSAPSAACTLAGSLLATAASRRPAVVRSSGAWKVCPA